jgi:hypothetical protein
MITLLDKTYSAESICDVDRDVSECWSENDSALPKDES